MIFSSIRIDLVKLVIPSLVPIANSPRRARANSIIVSKMVLIRFHVNP